MQLKLIIAVTSLFVLLQKRSNGAPMRGNGNILARDPKFPRFMENLYYNVRSGKLHLLDIVHSNEAIDIKTSNSSFEAMFGDLNFIEKEILKHAKLRLKFLTIKNCTPHFTLQVYNGDTLQLIDEQDYVAKRHGVTYVPLTRPLKKFILARPNVNNKSLYIKLDFRSLTVKQASCVNIVDTVSQDAYLVTHTKERYNRRTRRDTNTSRRHYDHFRTDTEDLRQTSSQMNTESSRKNIDLSQIETKSNASESESHREDTEDFPKSTYRGVAKRSASSSKTCTVRSVYVNLTQVNGSIALPHGFKTNVCGTWQPIPIGSDPTVKEVAKAIHNALKKLPKSNDPSCCVPTAFKKLHILYVDRKEHVVLRFLDRINVTKCGCK